MTNQWEAYRQHELLPQLPEPRRPQHFVVLLSLLQRSIANLVVSELPSNHRARHFEHCWLLEINVAQTPDRPSRLTWEPGVTQARLAMIETTTRPSVKPLAGDSWKGWSWYG